MGGFPLPETGRKRLRASGIKNFKAGPSLFFEQTRSCKSFIQYSRQSPEFADPGINRPNIVLGKSLIVESDFIRH